MKRWVYAAAALCAAAVAAAGSGSALANKEQPATFGAADCTSLVGRTIPAKAIDLPTTGAVVKTATFVTDSGGQCRVVGDIKPVDATAPPIEFQVNLPVNWNNDPDGWRRLRRITGYGARAVRAAAGNAADAAAAGFVTLGSDGGHKGVGFDARFGLNDEALRNYGQESIKKTHDAAMVLIDALYHAQPNHFYFIGFSQGGHEALDAAGRYPKDYDGVIAGTPAYNVTMMHAGSARCTATRDRDGGIGWINPTKRQLLVNAVYAACDAIDGLADGVISNTSGCLHAFDVESLRCLGGVDSGNTCLSDPQIETVKMIAAGEDLGFEIAGNSFAAPGRS